MMKSPKLGMLLISPTFLRDFFFFNSSVYCTAIRSYVLLSSSLTGRLLKYFVSRLGFSRNETFV